MSVNVTDFWNALHVVNTTGNNVSCKVQANGYKQLFTLSGSKRNVPDNHTSDDYVLTVPANASVTVGAGIGRNGSFDQSASLDFTGLGVLSFNGTTTVHGSDISQNVSWAGAANVTVPTGVTWNFNHATDPVLTITIS